MLKDVKKVFKRQKEEAFYYSEKELIEKRNALKKKSIEATVKSVNEEFNYSNANLKLSTIQFLLEMDSYNLVSELEYQLNDSRQIKIYNKYEEYKVLHLTKEQLELFNKYNFNIERFLYDSVYIDSIVVHEKCKINYKFMDSKQSIQENKDKIKYIDKEEKGLLFLTSDTKGCLGSGIYVCDTKNRESVYLFNDLINDRATSMAKSSGLIMECLAGYYNGEIKRCIAGRLKGMVVLKQAPLYAPRIIKENLELYGAEIEEEISMSKDDLFEINLQQYLPEFNISLRSSSFENKISSDDAVG